jgi:hypothetical protein
MDAFISRRPVFCLPTSLDRYGRTVAKCKVGGVDLGEWLVSGGLALDWPRFSEGKYGAVQQLAERAGKAATSSLGATVFAFEVVASRQIARTRRCIQSALLAYPHPERRVGIMQFFDLGLLTRQIFAPRRSIGDVRCCVSGLL